MPGLLDFPNGAAFGTGSPAETSRQPAGLLDFIGGLYNSFGGVAKRALGESANAVGTGVYNPAPAVEAAMNIMGGGMPIAERGALGMAGGRIKVLPSMESLQDLPHPSVQNLKDFARIEAVDLNKARTLQDGRGGMNWEGNAKGEYAPALFDGYGTMPVAVRKETGEYVVLDGNHRTVNAINSGAKNLDMHVIDAKDYAPRYAGVKPAPPKMSDDELLSLLMGK